MNSVKMKILHKVFNFLTTHSKLFATHRLQNASVYIYYNLELF